MYAVYDHKRKRKVALKALEKQDKPTLELDILKQLKHPRIVKLHGHFMFRGFRFFTTELLSNHLFRLLQQRKFFSLALLHRIAVQVLEALAFMQRVGVMHCDIKPENIVLKRGKSSEVKLIDFGVARYIGTHTDPYIQSRFYRAPEVMLGLPYSSPVDMWSFGCLVCELLTGKPVFEGETDAQMLSQIAEVLGPPPAGVFPPGELDAAVASCTLESRLYEPAAGLTDLVTSKWLHRVFAMGPEPATDA